MANDHARIRRDIWADDDWRRLTSSGQWLYMHLLSAPTLNFAGVADWRPPRIAALTAELSASDVDYFAAELIGQHFILPDLETEEVLIRSWVKHDGLLRSPNMTKALVKAHDKIASGPIRGVIVDQLQRLADGGMEGCWDHLEGLLGKTSYTFEEGVELLSDNPSGNPSPNPSGKGSGNPSGNPSEKGSEIRPSLHTPYSILLTPHHGSPSVDQVGAADKRASSSKRKAG